MKVAIWANSPSPHQADFYVALRRSQIDLRVVYLGDIRASRLALGWAKPAELPSGEQILDSGQSPFNVLPDWRQRVHIIPGYSRRFNLQMAVTLSRAGVPWVHWSENSQPSWRSLLTFALKRWYARLINQHALGAFAIGRHAARDFVRWGVRHELISHLYYAIDGASPQETPDPITVDFVAGRTAFVYVGSMCHNKASTELLRAFAAVAAKQRDLALVVVGDGPQLNSCRRLADTHGLHGSVLFRGVVPRSNIGSVLACCKVLVLPSRYDGWGVVLNEAASAGLAIVATDRVGAADHLLEPGLNGFLVRAGSVESLTTAFHAYSGDPHLATVHGTHSRALFQRFTPDMNAQRFVVSIRGWLARQPQLADFQAQWRAASSATASQLAAA